MKDFRYMAIVAVAAAGLALAGCSSSSGVSTSERDAAVEAEQAKTKALQDRIDALYAALGIDEDADPNATIADLQTKANELEQMVADKEKADAEADRKAATDLANMIAPALEKPADRADGGNDATVTAITATASRKAGAMPTIKIAGGGTTERMADKFKVSDMMAPSISGVHGNVQTRSGAAPTDPMETVTIYTDIDAPKVKNVLFSAYYSQTNADDRSEISAGISSSSERVTPATITAMTADLFVSSDFPSGNRMRYTYGTGETDRADASEGLDGSFNGVAGKYFCPDNCSAQTGANGKLQSLGGTWTFDPDSDTAMISQVTADGDYMYFGYWLESDQMEAKVGYRFHAFSGGSDGYNKTGGINSVTGKASYMGPAAGMYVTKTFDGGDLASAESGEFTATATLEANFEDENESGMISGTVSDFVTGGEPQDGWSVTLREAAIDDAIIGTTSGKIGDASGTGTWSAAFYGNPSSADSTGDLAHPTGVAGEFDAHLPAAHIAGGFAAKRQ